MFQANVTGLYLDQHTGEPVVVLREIEGDRFLPIWIGANEMLSLAIRLSPGEHPPSRPLSHDLIGAMLQRLEARVVRAIICALENHIYRARLILESGSGILEIDSRPSDAIVLALRADAPILIAEEVVAERIRLAEENGQDPDAVWARLQQIRPEDFNTQSL